MSDGIPGSPVALRLQKKKKKEVGLELFEKQKNGKKNATLMKRRRAVLPLGTSKQEGEEVAEKTDKHAIK